MRWRFGQSFAQSSLIINQELCGGQTVAVMCQKSAVAHQYIPEVCSLLVPTNKQMHFPICLMGWYFSIPRGPSSAGNKKPTGSEGERGGAVVTPTIILHFQLSDGRYRTLELPLAMFHRLRYNVAVLLSEMQSLQQRAVMKKF